MSLHQDADRKARPVIVLVRRYALVMSCAALAWGLAPVVSSGQDAAAEQTLALPRLAQQQRDVSTPFPIDRGDNRTFFVAYQGLRLGLVDNGEPPVTPVDGIIGVVCVGMSNGNQECNDFIERLDSGEYAGQINPAVRFANCAVGSHAIERWIDPAFDATLWDACLATKIGMRGIRADQVRVIWHKAADQFTTASRGEIPVTYPDPASNYFVFYDNLTRFAQRLRAKMPSVQAVYTSSRSYGGFARRLDRSEPRSYEEGLALNAWLAAFPAFGGAWYGWGPYIWAPECASGQTNRSGECYAREDFGPDGVHPTESGEAKVSRMLHLRLGQEDWYRF